MALFNDNERITKMFRLWGFLVPKFWNSVSNWLCMFMQLEVKRSVEECTGLAIQVSYLIRQSMGLVL